MVNVVVTGGAGYIGSRLCSTLLQNGFRVTCVDIMMHGIEPVLSFIDHPNFKLHVVDICDKKVESIIKSADYVIHLAGIVGFPACASNVDLSNKINVEGTKRVVDSSAGIPIIYSSTGSVYGDLNKTCTESCETNPISEYSIQKLIGEQMLDENSVVLRLATAYGVSNRLRNDLLINDFVTKAIADKHMVLFESHFKRTFISVNDIVRGFMLSLKEFNSMKSNVWNLGDERLNATKLDIVKLIQKHVPDFTYTINTKDSLDKDMRNYFVDYTKIRTQMGYIANETLDQGIENLVKIYKALDNRTNV